MARSSLSAGIPIRDGQPPVRDGERLELDLHELTSHRLCSAALWKEPDERPGENAQADGHLKGLCQARASLQQVCASPLPHDPAHVDLGLGCSEESMRLGQPVLEDCP